MNVLPSRADPCIWLRKAPNLRCYEYIAVYVDDLCIAAESPSAIIQIFKSKYHLNVKEDGRLTYHLGADYFEDPDGTFVSQPKKYIDKLADTYKRLFNDDPPKGYKTPLDKNDHPELDTSEILEGDMAAKYLTMVGQLQCKRILSIVQKSFWSCTHVNSCQKYTLYINLHILLNILS